MQVRVFFFCGQQTNLITQRADGDGRASYRYRSRQLALEDIAHLLGADCDRQLNWNICETVRRL